MLKSHKDELTSYNKAYRNLKKHGVDLNVNLDALQSEYDKLKATHTELAGQLATVKEELQPMKEIRYWVGKVLTPEQSEVEKSPNRSTLSKNACSMSRQKAKRNRSRKLRSTKTEYGTLTGTCRFLL